MALRVAARRSSALQSPIKCLRVVEGRVSRRNASAMAVPTSSQSEMTRDDISVSLIYDGLSARGTDT